MKKTKISNLYKTVTKLNIKYIPDLQSTWPVGSYALPMSKYGCPEDVSRGWSRGYINISLVHPINVTFWNASVQADSTLENSDQMSINDLENVYVKGRIFLQFEPEDIYCRGEFPEVLN